MMRMASVIWQAGLKDGTGLISTESGVLQETPYSVNPSFEWQPVTNPEELIAAALASSFSTALSTELDKDGLIPESIRTAAGLTMERLESGWIITQIHLEVRVKLLKGDLDKFESAAKAAKANCTMSHLLTTKITMDAQLERGGSFGEIARKSGPISLGERLVTIPLQEENELSK